MIYAFLTLLAIVLVAVLVSLSNQLQKGTDSIRESLLERIPIGTNMEDVLNAIENNKNWGILQEGAWKPWPSGSDSAIKNYKKSFIEAKSINVLIGKYRSLFNFFYLFEVYVGVDWRFDKDLKLVDIEVRKDQAGF